jgi:hypothetical protein
LLLVCAAAVAAEPSLIPLTVCEAVAEFASHQGKTVALLGRYSFRTTGRWLDQEGCGEGKNRVSVSLTADSASGPKPPDTVSIDEATLESKLTAIKRGTSLGKFKFGSQDYDRWAVIFGRLEGDAEKPHLIYRGDGAMFILVDK